MWIMPKIESKNRSEKKTFSGKRCEDGEEKSAKKGRKGVYKEG